MKLHCLNLASGSTMAVATPGEKISPQKRRGLRHVISFGMKACLFIARQHTIDIAILSICP